MTRNGLLTFIFLILLTPSAFAQTEAELKKWVGELSSPSFETRELAMSRLMESGKASVPHLQKELLSASPEAITRILHVLKRQVLKGDLELQQLAREAIESATKEDSPQLKQRALLAFAKVNEHRNRRASLELMRLGARIETKPLAIGRENRRLVEVVSIHLGEEWIGKDADLVRLGWLTNVRHVELTGKTVQPGWLKHVFAIKNLEYLSISECPLLDEQSLEPVFKVANLQFLDIRYVPITDKFASRLSKLQKLSAINLYGTQISEDGAVALQKALAAADVDWRRGAFLGVGCDSPPLPCRVTSVGEGTAADRIGVRIGDIITEFDSKPIKTFDDLRAVISKKVVGDKSQIVITRRLGTIRATPGQSIIVKKDVPLGLEVEKHVLGCRVTKVDPKGAAKTVLGISVGTIITNIQGNPATGPADLEAYKTATEGTRFNITSFRAKQISGQVEFGRWKNLQFP